MNVTKVYNFLARVLFWVTRPLDTKRYKYHSSLVQCSFSVYLPVDPGFDRRAALSFFSKNSVWVS